MKRKRRKGKTQKERNRKVIQNTVSYLVRELKKEGITIQRYDSYSSNIDLLEKVSRKPRNDSPIHRENRRILGPSIEERPNKVESRQEFGHWEIDTLDGARTKNDPVLLTLIERKTRFEIILEIAEQTQKSVDQAIDNLYNRISEQADKIFKTITADNDSEFAGIYNLLKEKTDVFFARPYASYERGTKENQHRLIRRFIPKSKSVAEITNQTVSKIQKWINNIPRKILGYQTAEESFLKEL